MTHTNTTFDLSIILLVFGIIAFSTVFFSMLFELRKTQLRYSIAKKSYQDSLAEIEDLKSDLRHQKTVSKTFMMGIDSITSKNTALIAKNNDLKEKITVLLDNQRKLNIKEFYDKNQMEYEN